MLMIIRISFALLVLLPVAALAQTAPPPLIVERVDNTFVVAPDYKVTDLDGTLGQLAGAYAGRVFDETLMIGGAGYWLVNGSRGDELAYGGLLVGWSAPERVVGIRFGARGLVGVGSGTLGRDITIRGGPAGIPDRRIRFGGATGSQPGGLPAPSSIRILARDDFFVFEPQVTAGASLFRHITLNLGAGYRLTGFTDALDDSLNGVTGSLALQFDW
jgi:hypothetical protein